MTNKERVIAAIRFQEKDFCPYNVQFTSQCRENFLNYTKAHGIPSQINNHITLVDLNLPLVELPDKKEYFRDEYGVVWNRTGVDKDIGVVEDLLISDEEDLEAYEFPPVEEVYIRERMEWLQESDPSKFRVACIGYSMFERAWSLMGMEDLLCNMIVEPELVHALLRKICDRNLKTIDIALEYDFDCFHFGDDWGQQKGMIMGPDHWREFIKPYVSEMYDRVRKAGKFVSQHSCGDIREVMDDVIEMGLNIYQTFQPEIYGLDYAEKLYGRLAIWGGISVQADLPYKTPEEIREITKNTLQAFQKGGLIASPTHAVPPDVPPENLLAMLDVFTHQP